MKKKGKKINLKAKGTNAERALLKLFWEQDTWAAIRTPGSGCARFPSPDILAGNSIRRLAIECKLISNYNVYIPKKEIEQLKIFASKFGAEPWLAIMFNNKELNSKEWFFLSLDDVNETEKNICVSTNLAKTKGLLFEEVIKS
ncbi:Holliday junction resolvase [Candidatus Woesearchaeota archaeon]|jgi:holliday junction resolvase Hjr|nr:Holliday junction resolvase [Candidatus Woesearchaeota archaeon]MBT6336749.1 Holliday junction resolvase [Candidatus Woesearchaeota archaeon]MBT7928122.1 Holliday junction resolvase [Candidatus Woesearchaeota archaeon]